MSHPLDGRIVARRKTFAEYLKLDEMARKERERAAQVKLNMMAEAQERRQLRENERLSSRITPWMVDEQGNRWRQVGDLPPNA